MVAWNSLYCIAHNLELAFFDGLREEHLLFLTKGYASILS